MQMSCVLEWSGACAACAWPAQQLAVLAELQVSVQRGRVLYVLFWLPRGGVWVPLPHHSELRRVCFLLRVHDVLHLELLYGVIVAVRVSCVDCAGTSLLFALHLW
jgi:hypothetical protein